ncbi:MAG: HAD family hydrolase [Candidatus Brocadiaceae bacterium]|nr:HAD family hydrolase [Candidatus Brocadiaceae bacterium]
MASVKEVVLQKKAVVFDLFHTLTAIESSWGKGLPFTCDMLGVSREAWDDQLQVHSRARLTGQVQDPIRIIGEMARAIDPTIGDVAVVAAVANRVRRFEAALLDIPDETVAVLQTLKSRGKRLGLISNADVMEVEAWGRSPVAGFFDAAVFSCLVGTVKPEREIYEFCLNRLGVSPSEAAFVGDGGSSELQGARAAGMVTVMITGIIRELWPDRIEERKAHADFVIERLPELV